MIKKSQGYLIMVFLFFWAIMSESLMLLIISTNILFLVIFWKIINYFVKTNQKEKLSPLQESNLERYCRNAYPKRKYRKTYIDKQGYKRYKDNGRLVHRETAYNQIYIKDIGKYPLRFREYDIHHIDGNKLNNKSKNLQILTREQHKQVHGIL